MCWRRRFLESSLKPVKNFSKRLSVAKRVMKSSTTSAMASYPPSRAYSDFLSCTAAIVLEVTAFFGVWAQTAPANTTNKQIGIESLLIISILLELGRSSRRETKPDGLPYIRPSRQIQ